MYLKEAFRHQNVLMNLFNTTVRLLSDSRNTLYVTQEHLRNKACPDASDETIDLSKDREVPYKANDLLDFMVHIVGEKEELTAAISRAKAACDTDIDAEIANNKVRQSVARIMSRMNQMRDTERTFRASDYKFNAEGNQTPYSYEVHEISTIGFDRNKVKAIHKQVVDKCDDVSTAIDRAMINVVVDYEPKYDFTVTFDDAIKSYLDTK